MHVNEKISEIIQLIHRKTLHGELDWTSTANNKVIVRIGPRWVGLSKSSDEWSQPIYTFEMYNEGGDIVEAVTDEDLTGMSPQGFRSFFDLLDELFDKADLKARGVDETLDGLLSDLTK